MTRELLPLPLTPVTQISLPRGKATSMRLRLLCLTPRTTSCRPLPDRRPLGIGICRSWRRYWAVSESRQVRNSASGAEQTTCPPCSPAPGPMSNTQSAERMVSWSCSTTSTVFPRSRIPLSVSSKRALSRWCRPIEGSSRIYRQPISWEPIWVARRMRCASPPDRVLAARPNVR